MPKPPITWRLSGVLSGVTLGDFVEAGAFAAISPNDPRYAQVTQRSLVTAGFLQQFKTPFGVNVEPTIIVNRLRAEKIKAQELTDFRNMVSICCQLHGFALRYDRNAGVLSPVYSDFFDIFPAWPDEDCELRSPHEVMTRGVQDVPGNRWELTTFTGSPPFGVFDPLTTRPDKYLFDALRNLFDDRSASSALMRRRVFRALEVVRLATRAPISNLGSQQDHALPFAHWVSAFEILAHIMGSPNGKVGMKSVLRIVNDVPWSHSELRKKKVREHDWNEKTQKSLPVRVTKADQVYRRMYRVRNDYLHGNEITDRTIEKKWRRSRGHLQGRAPSLFRAYLMRILANKGYTTYFDQATESLEILRKSDDVRLYEYPLFGVHRGG